MSDNFDTLLDEFDLDYLFIDTHPGLNKETMLAAALSEILIILVRPDQQDYYGTAVLTEIAAELEVPKVYLIANKVYARLDPAELLRHGRRGRAARPQPSTLEFRMKKLGITRPA